MYVAGKCTYIIPTAVTTCVCTLIYTYIHKYNCYMYTFICSHTRVYLRFDESKSSKRPGFANTTQYSMILNCVRYFTITARSSSKLLRSRCDVFRPKSNILCRWSWYMWLRFYHYYFLFVHEELKSLLKTASISTFWNFSGWSKNNFMVWFFFSN